jgi:hypothetical protein
MNDYVMTVSLNYIYLHTYMEHLGEPSVIDFWLKTIEIRLIFKLIEIEEKVNNR